MLGQTIRNRDEKITAGRTLYFYRNLLDDVTSVLPFGPAGKAFLLGPNN